MEKEHTKQGLTLGLQMKHLEKKEDEKKRQEEEKRLMAKPVVTQKLAQGAEICTLSTKHSVLVAIVQTFSCSKLRSLARRGHTSSTQAYFLAKKSALLTNSELADH